MIWIHHRCNFWVLNEIVSSSLPGPRLVTGHRKSVHKQCRRVCLNMVCKAMYYLNRVSSTLMCLKYLFSNYMILNGWVTNLSEVFNWYLVKFFFICNKCLYLISQLSLCFLPVISNRFFLRTRTSLCSSPQLTSRWWRILVLITRIYFSLNSIHHGNLLMAHIT